MINKRSVGSWGEDIAARFLVQKGYTIICRNFHARVGEIDIIAWHDEKLFGKTLCFIEVKTRGAQDGSAERSVGYKKKKNMAKAATFFCVKHKIDQHNTPIVFEQVSIYKKGDGVQARILEIPDVFC